MAINHLKIWPPFLVKILKWPSKIAIKNHLKIYPPLLGDHTSAGLWALKNAEYAR